MTLNPPNVSQIAAAVGVGQGTVVRAIRGISKNLSA
jgi:DNA-binding MarR family transcriptional regulator